MSSPAVIEAAVLNCGFRYKPKRNTLVSVSFPSSVFLGTNDLKNFVGLLGSDRFSKAL